MLDDVFDSPDDLLSTPFEDWCASGGIHPEALGAWDQYSRGIDGQTVLAS